MLLTEFTATASNIGYGWWSHDIGGHFKGYKDDELATTNGGRNEGRTSDGHVLFSNVFTSEGVHPF